ncbi:MAG: hypothetical protein JWR09_800 [Mucilaginibacter sp.]|nr:hypothetical protein [Mucilaginibacter sp.]
MFHFVPGVPHVKMERFAPALINRTIEMTHLQQVGNC